MNHRCRCHTCKTDYKAFLREKRKGNGKQHHEKNPSPRLRGYDTMTREEYYREQPTDVPRSTVRRSSWKQSAI